MDASLSILRYFRFTISSDVSRHETQVHSTIFFCSLPEDSSLSGIPETFFIFKTLMGSLKMFLSKNITVLLRNERIAKFSTGSFPTCVLYVAVCETKSSFQMISYSDPQLGPFKELDLPEILGPLKHLHTQRKQINERLSFVKQLTP